MTAIDSALEKLALDGGPRTLEGATAPWPIQDEDIRRVLDAAWADGSWGRYHGPHCERLAHQLAELHGGGFVTLCCSGTLAVELALRGLKVGAGDEVILAGYDFPGNFRAIEAISARPVLVDVAAESCLLDVDRLLAAVGPRARAIVVSHLHSELADMPGVMEVARRRGLLVVEDACQAPGSVVAGRVAGSWGDVGVLSFGGSKLLSAGRGGALVTVDQEVHQRIKVFSNRGNSAFPLSELQAAVLAPQLAKLAQRNGLRRASVKHLLDETAGIAGLVPLVSRLADAAASYYKLAWRYDPQAFGGASIDEFLAALVAEGAPFDRGFRGFAGRGARRCRKAGTLDESRRAAESTILLHHPILLEPAQRIESLARAMSKVARAFSESTRIR